MANNAISDIGNVIQVSGGVMDNDICLGDGNAKPGEAIYIDPADGKAKGVDGDSATAGIHFAGFLDRHPELGIDVALTAAKQGKYLKPKSGEILNVFIEDPGAAAYKGSPLTWGQTTPGSLKMIVTTGATGTLTPTLDSDSADVISEPIVAYLDKDIANGDTVARIRMK